MIFRRELVINIDILILNWTHLCSDLVAELLFVYNPVSNRIESKSRRGGNKGPARIAGE
jgi:hypothetical protein